MYGILIFLSIILALFIVEKRVKRNNLDVDLFWSVSFWTILFGIIGARIYHVLDFFDIYSRNPVGIIQIWNGGLGIFGAFIAGFVTLYFYLKKNKQNLMQWLDIIVLPIPLAQSIGRWGNYFNGELIPYCLYESFLNMLLFLLMLFLDKRPLKTGRLFILYMVGYSLIRLILEPFRNDSAKFMGLNVAQSISILLILLGIYLWNQKQKKS